MNEKLAKYISIIFSPFFTLPIFALWVIAVYADSFNHFFLWAGTFLVLTVVPPALFIAYEVKTGKFSDMHLAIRQQRWEPFLVAILGAALLAGAYWLEAAPRDLFVLALTFVANGIVFFLVTLLWKVSVHVSAFFGSVFIVSIFIKPVALWLLFFLPAVMWARVKRARHDLRQELAALVLVTASCAAVFHFFGII